MQRYLFASLLAGLLALPGCGGDDRADGGAQPAQITVYCAAGIRQPVEELKKVFERKHNTAVRTDYAGTGELLGRLKTASAPEYRPDIFVAAEESYADQAAALGLVDRRETLAYFIPVIVVPKGSTKVRELADLARPDVIVSLGEARGPAIGLITDQILEGHGLKDAVRGKTKATYDTVQKVAMPVVLGHADAGIVWDVTARQGDFAEKLDMIAIPNAPAVKIVICRVAQAPHPELADKFIDLLVDPAVASAGFEKFGFTVKAPTSQPER